jgi:palmitoyl-protein thioesterase
MVANMWSLCSTVVLLVSSIAVRNGAHGYRPVILMHGLLVSSESMEPLREMILEAHPGTPVHNVDAYNGPDSFKPMWEQVHGVYSTIAPILDSSPQGAILIGHSQGGVIFRGILEAYPTHNITLIALASPLAGQYGDAQLNEIIPFITREMLYQ